MVKTAPIVTIQNIRPDTGSTVEIIQWVVDDAHGNFWPAWFADMNSRGLTNEDFTWASRYTLDIPMHLKNSRDQAYWYSREDVYKTLAMLEPKTSQLTITGNILTLTPELAHHGIIFYEISNVSPVQ